jgi:hypothetical protein
MIHIAPGTLEGVETVFVHCGVTVYATFDDDYCLLLRGEYNGHTFHRSYSRSMWNSKGNYHWFKMQLVKDMLDFAKSA